MSPSIWQILLVVVLAVLLFGRGKISGLMGDVAKGITAFKRGMKEGADDDAEKQRLAQEKATVDVSATESKVEGTKS